jgi:hypothetical protein
LNTASSRNAKRRRRGVWLILAIAAVAFAAGSCEAPHKRPRTAQKRQAAGPAQQGAGEAAPAPEHLEPGDDAVFDPEYPCLTRGQARRGEAALLGKRERPDIEVWLRTINRTLHEFKADCADDHLLTLVITTVQMESNVRVDPAVAVRDLEELYILKLKQFRQESTMSAQVLNLSGLDGLLRAKLRKDTQKGKVRTEGDLDRYVRQDLRPWLMKTLRTDFLLPESMARTVAERALGDPVHTIGPMQVSFGKAFNNARKRGEKLASAQEMKRQLLDPETAMYRGIKEGVYLLLLSYRHYRPLMLPEEAVLYTAADYNGGEFSSRNAAFQERLAALAGRPLSPDGDLLIYRDGKAEATRSLTEDYVELALHSEMSPSAVRRDLLLEKGPEFSESETARRVCVRYQARFKQECKPARLPKGAANPSAEIKSGQALTPANYAHAYLKRFQGNWLVYQGHAPLADPDAAVH